MDAIWTALDKAKPSRRKEWEKIDENSIRNKKTLDWMTL